MFYWRGGGGVYIVVVITIKFQPKNLHLNEIDVSIIIIWLGQVTKYLYVEPWGSSHI